MVGERVRGVVGALAFVAVLACSANAPTPGASGTTPQAPSGTATAPAGTAPPGTTSGRSAAPRPTPPRTAPGPAQPWGEGGATVVQFATLGFPSYTIGAPAADPTDRLWLDAGTVNQRCLVDIDPLSTDLTATVEPLGKVATGDDGSVWFSTDHGAVRRDADGKSVAYDVGDTVGSELVARPITVDPQGRAWVTLTGENAIVRIGRDGPVTRFAQGIPPNASPGTIDAGPDGSVWFAEPDVHQVGRANPDGVIEQHTVGGAPELVTAARDGSAWFYDSETSTFGHIDAGGGVTRVANTTTSAPVIDLTVAPDGTVWYVADPGIVGRFGDGLALQELPITDESGNPTRASFHHPKGITAGADGTMWFTDSFYGGEGTIISVYAVVDERPTTWPVELPVRRQIGSTLATCGDG